MSDASESGCRSLPIDRCIGDGLGSTPDPEAADSSVRSNDQADMSDRWARRHQLRAEDMIMMRTQLNGEKTRNILCFRGSDLFITSYLKKKSKVE